MKFEVHMTLDWEPGKQDAMSQLAHVQTRIAALDKTGPCLNAVLEWNPDAEGIAAGLDRARERQHGTGKLHGMPMLLKDNIGTADGMHTSAGTLALGDRFAPADAFLVSRLRAEGAVLCGKTNMTELANFMTEGMPNGYSSRGGQVRHAWVADGDPSGSSSGSAVAVAAGYVPVAIGTETCGSIISPAMHAGIAAIKPSVGWVSRAGIIPIAPSQDTAGPMARSLRDCARVLEVMIGIDAADPVTESQAGCPTPNLSTCDRYAGGLSGVRIGVFMKDESGAPCETPAFLAALDVLRDMGAEVVPFQPPAVEMTDMLEVLVHEFRPAMDAALRADVGQVRTLADIAAFNAAYAGTCLRYGQVWVDKAVALHHPMLSPSYLAARARIRQARQALSHQFSENRLSAVASPQGLLAIPVTGGCSVTFPIGMDDEKGVPVPIVLEAPSFHDAELLAVGAALEKKIRRMWSPVYPFDGEPGTSGS
jgi:amidase